MYVNMLSFDARISKTLRHVSTSRLHQMLGDFLSHNSEHQEALDQYSIALRLVSVDRLFVYTLSFEEYFFILRRYIE